MKSLLVAALGLGLGAGCTAAQAQEGPRQLGGAPSVPTYTPRPAPAPAQLGTAPAAPAPAAVATTPPDSAAVPGAAPAAAATPAAAPRPGPAGGNQPYIMGGSTRPTRYQVGLRNGQLYNVYDVEVKSPLFGRSYLLLDGQRRVDLNEVGFYENETGHYVRTTLPNSSREATLRREKTGRISLYATYNTSYSPGYYGAPGLGYGGLGYGGFGYGGFGGYPYGGYRTTKTEYFSKDNGPIQYLNTRNLQLATVDNPGAQALLANARRYQTSITAAYVVGGGLLLAGLVQSFRPNTTGISPLLYASIPVLIVPLIFQGKQSSAQRQAIALYNSGMR